MWSVRQGMLYLCKHMTTVLEDYDDGGRWLALPEWFRSHPLITVDREAFPCENAAVVAGLQLQGSLIDKKIKNIHFQLK